MDKYLKVIEKLTKVKQQLREVEIEKHGYGCSSFQVTGMPTAKGGTNDRRETLIDTGIMLSIKVQALYMAADLAKREIEAIIEQIPNPQARLVHRLKFINGLTNNEIAEETERSYWAITKLLKRYKNNA